MHPAPRTRFGSVAIALHWATAALVLMAFLYGPGGSEQRVYSAARDFERQLHETLGLCVFVLAAVRLAWRAVDERPAPVPAPGWMQAAALAVQASLYVLLFAVPVSAIAGAWLEGHLFTLLVGVQVQPMVGESHALGTTIAELHTWLGDAILWLAGGHAAAGIYHHLALKDGVLVSMLPRRLASWLTLRR